MKLQTKSILLLFIVTIILSSAVLLLYHSEKTRLILEQNQEMKYKEQIFDSIVKLKGTTLKSFVFDYTYWDDMVAFVSTVDPKWAHENIVQSLSNYNADAVWVYNTSKKLVFSYA